MGPEISLVIPVRNEASRIWSSTLKLFNIMQQLGKPFEVILVENGSIDDTQLVASWLGAKYSFLKCLSIPNASLGEALKAGLQKANGEKVVCYPLDLSVDISFIKTSLKMLDDFDIVIASKRVGGGDGRPLIRRIASTIFHGLVRFLCNTRLSDTTCAKAYRRSSFIPLLELIPGKSRIFETELLIEAERQGLRIKELPVNVHESRRSREALIDKATGKLKDLASYRLDTITMLIGIPMLLLGMVWFLFLLVDKLSNPYTGLENPYSTILVLILIVGGFQISSFGLLSRLLLQVRRESGQLVLGSNKVEITPVGYTNKEDDSN